MTTAELGRQLKQVHPEYRDVPDAKLGAALKAKFPGFYDHATDDLDSSSTPETPRTLAIQLEQLQDGARRVVFVARGSKDKINAADYGMKRITLPPGDFIYDPKAIKPREIIAAVNNHELADILGSATKGYGAPDKTELQGDPMAVVARDADGETANSALTDPEHLEQTIEAAGDVTPQGGAISVEPPHVELEHRTSLGKKRRGHKWPKPNNPVKLPVGG